MLDFEKIDTEEKAYILGFIAADGCIQSTKKGYLLSIEVASTDQSHLELLRDILNPTTKIYEYHRLNRPDSQTTVNLRIYSKLLFNQLFKHGLHPRKTFTVLPPIGLSKELIHHWIRGYFDGDGTIYIKNRSNRLSCGVTSGSYGVLDYIQTNFNDIGVRKNNIHKEENCFTIKYTGQVAIRFLNYIYQGAHIYLGRKYKIFIDYTTNNERGIGEWTIKEIDRLTEVYAFFPREELIAIFPRRSWVSIKMKASRLGLLRKVDERSMGVEKRTWTEEEDIILTRFFSISPKSFILDQLPNRSWYSISARATRYLGLSRRSKFKNQYDTLDKTKRLSIIG